MNLQEVYGMSIAEFREFVNETISDEDIVEMFRYANIISDEEKENILNKKESENKNNEY
jgi:hypothetical protein